VERLVTGKLTILSWRKAQIIRNQARKRVSPVEKTLTKESQKERN
jgi:hypothetical protein